MPLVRPFRPQSAIRRGLYPFNTDPWANGASGDGICFGTSGLGHMPETYGHEVGEERALLTLQADFDEPVNVLDRSSNYGLGQSEERIGAVTRERDSLPEGFVVSTNLDRDSDTRRRLADGLTPEKLKHVAILTAPALCRLRAAKGLAWIEDFTGRKHLVEG